MRYCRSTFCTRALAAVLAVALLALLPAVAQARSYRVDVIVFTDATGIIGDEQPTPARLPSGGISADDVAVLAAHGIHVLPPGASTLQHQWNALRYSANFHPVKMLSWTQGRAASGTAIRIDIGVPLALDGGSIASITGRIALYTGAQLHIDAHFSDNFGGANGNVVSYRLSEVRRVKFDQIHYLDSPRLGILVRVTNLG